MQKNVIIAVVAAIAVVLIGVGIYFAVSGGSNEERKPENIMMSSSTQETQTQVSNLPELPQVVARVNGVEITGDQLVNAETQLVANQGIDISILNDEMHLQARLQALDSLISNELVKLAVAATGTVASDEDVNERLEAVKSQFADQAKYEEALSQQGMTETDLHDLIVADLSAQKYLEDTLGLLNMDASEDEINTFYEQEKASSTTDTFPELSEVSEQIKALLIRQKQQDAVLEHIEMLKTKAEVEVLI